MGKSVPKVDALDKVTGGAKYVADIWLPGMLYGKILRSSLPHARIKSIDTSRAERLPGVVGIVTHKDVPRVLYNSSQQAELRPRDKYVLDDKVRYVGDEVAAVAALDKDTAETALELIDVEYEELPAVFDPEEALKPDAPKIHGGENNICAFFQKEWGNLEKGFQEADLIFEDTYKTQATHATPIEPHGCLVSHESGNLRIWTSLQAPHPFRNKLATIFGVPASKIRITNACIGGAFGNKCDLLLEPVTICLSMKTNKPVRTELTREEVFMTTKRHPSIVKLKTGVKSDGTLVAREVKSILGAGAYSSHTPGVAFAHVASSSNLLTLYKTPHFKGEVRAVYTNTIPSGAFRGYGNPQGAFPVESQLDQIAEELKIDPIEFRLKNIIRPGDVNPATGMRIASSGLEDCVTRIKGEMNWDGKKRKGKQLGTKRRGLGIAFMMHTSGVFGLDETCSAMVKINPDGTVFVQSAAVDLGTGAKTTIAQIVSEELSVEMKQVKITEEADTIYLQDRGSYGSGTLYVSGEAARRAAADAKGQLLKEAAKRLDAKVESLGIENGHVFVKGRPKKRISMAEVIKSMPGSEVVGVAAYSPTRFAVFFGAQCAEVEIDTETGNIALLKIAYAHDIGKAINPSIVEGQLEGGTVQGLGYALTEKLFINERTGQCLNAGFTDYRIPHAREYPNLKIILVESKEDTGPFSAKGCGEACLVPTLPAVANAVYDAVGVRIKEMPITSEIILRALKHSKIL